MKKMIIAAAIALAAVVSQAGTVSWSITKVDSSPVTTVGAGWYVALFDAGVEFDYAKLIAGDIEAAYTSTTVAAGTTGNFRVNKSEGAVVANQEYSYYAVVFDAAAAADAKYYIVSDVVTKTANASASNVSLGFGAMGATSGAFAGKQWTETVPEPTSGLLMLLGMAGLALRRRRA